MESTGFMVTPVEDEVPLPEVPTADEEQVADLPSNTVETQAVPMVQVPKWLKESGELRSRRPPSSTTTELLQVNYSLMFSIKENREPMYVEQSSGFTVPGTEGMVYKLRKVLYGLKQAPRAWNKKIDSLYNKGFRRSPADPNLYIYRKGGMVTLVILYVDDLVLTRGHADHIAAIGAALYSTFEMMVLGLLLFLLGLEVLHTQRGMFISQQCYVFSLLEAFGMEDARPISSPMDPNVKLIWLLNTKLDLSFSVGLLSSFMQIPLQFHWQEGLRILRYLRQSPDIGIWYPIGDGTLPILQGWSDANWGGDPVNRRSTSGYVFSLGHGAISWSSKRQPTVALSSTKAEYQAACSAT